MKFKNAYNSQEFPPDHEKNGLPSLTVPNQAMSIQEIMRRFAQGLTVEGERVPVYNGEEELPDLKRMDLVDRQEFAEHVKETITESRKKLKELDEEEKKKQARQLTIEEPDPDDRFRDDDQGSDDPPSKYPKKTPPEAPPAGSAKPRRRQESTKNP